MKLVWSPDTASKAYLSTVKSCKNFKKESGVAEFLSAMAAGWNAKLIVEAWSKGGPIATSVGLAVAAHHTCGRHVCVVQDEGSRSEYMKALQGAAPASAVQATEVVVGEAEEVMAGLAGVDFLVADCRRRDFVRVLRFARLGQKGAVLACKNASSTSSVTASGVVSSGFRWHGVLERGTRVVRAVFLPVGKGLDIAHIGSSGGGGGGGMISTRASSTTKRSGPGRWIKHVDQKSGEEHLFRG